MAFLAGSLGFDRFQVNGEQPEEFTQEHLDTLERLSCDKFQPSSEETLRLDLSVPASIRPDVRPQQKRNSRRLALCRSHRHEPGSVGHS